MKKVILDSNTYTRLVKDDEIVARNLEKAIKIYISVIMVGELLAGFENGKFERQNKKVFKEFLDESNVSVIDVSQETAKMYGKIKNILDRKGTPIPINDIWIAAHAVETGARIITYDKHFLKIPGLRIWDELKY